MRRGTSGLAHPDLWAGVIPIVATADKYVSRYWENGRYVPMYFVAGEMDGDKMGRNSMDLDRYLNKHTYDVVVVVFQGRGHEHFIDEIQRHLHLDGLAPPPVLSQGIRLRLDAALGQLFLVGRIGVAAQPFDRAAGQLAAGQRRPAGSHRRPHPGEQPGHFADRARNERPCGCPRKWSISLNGSASPSTAGRTASASSLAPKCCWRTSVPAATASTRSGLAWTIPAGADEMPGERKPREPATGTHPVAQVG